MERSSKLEFLARNTAKICIVRVRGHIHRCHHSRMAAHLDNNYFLPLLPFSALKSSFSLSFSRTVLNRSPWEFVLGVDSSCLFFQVTSSRFISCCICRPCFPEQIHWGTFGLGVVNSDLQRNASRAPLNSADVESCLEALFK